MIQLQFFERLLELRVIQRRKAFSGETEFLLLIDLFQITFLFVGMSNFILGLYSGAFTVNSTCTRVSFSPLCACTAPMVAKSIHCLEVEVFVQKNTLVHI